MSRSRSTSRSEPARPISLLASIWLVAIVLTGYCAADLRSWAHASAERDDSQLVDLADNVQAFGDATGLDGVRGELEHLRERIYKGAVAPPEPPPAQPVAPPPLSAPSPPAPASAATPAPRRAIKQALVIGASSIQFELGVALEAELKARGVVVKRFGRAATGLSQPEILDWPKRLEALLAGFAADTVIINFGGNDALAIKSGRQWIQWGAPTWAETYGARVRDLVERCQHHGALAVVIGMPTMYLTSFGQRMKVLNQITKDAAEAAGGIYLSQWEYSATAEGRYRQFIDVDGQRQLMRNPDGIHYSRGGAVYVAPRLLDDLQRVTSARP